MRPVNSRRAPIVLLELIGRESSGFLKAQESGEAGVEAHETYRKIVRGVFVSASDSNLNSHERGLDLAVAEYYRQLEAGAKLDRQAFLKRYPGLETELREFFTNLELFEARNPVLESGKRGSSFDEVSAISGGETLVTSRTPHSVSAVNVDTMLGDYCILECIGQGGMGTVYRAMHVRLQTQVAIKTLKLERVNSPEALLRFAREMRLLARLDHSNIVRALNAGEHEGTHYLVMELVSGIDLRRLVKRLGPLPIPEACKVVSLAAEALQYAHDQNILHRDVKPSNIMITAQGSVKLLDLGLANIFDNHLDTQLSCMDQAIGTLAYMAPKQLMGGHPVSNQSDVFSLGVSLYELLSGKRPFLHNGTSSLVADLRSLRPDLDHELVQILEQMISHDPSNRPQTMADVGIRLSRFATSADLSGLVAEYYRWNRRGEMAPTPPPVSKDIVPSSDAKNGSSRMEHDQVSSPRFMTYLRNLSPRKRIAGLLFVGALVVGTLAAVYQLLPNTNSKSLSNISSPVQPLPSEPMGQFEVVNNGNDELIAEIIAKGNLRVRPLTKGEESTAIVGVKEGLNDLPPGRYELLIPGPVDFKPVEFEVTESALTKLTPEILIKNYFQYPVLPEAGKFSGYHGRVRLANRPNKIPTPFDLYLEVLSEEGQGIERKKWLKVEVRCSLETGIYQEVGYLKVDASVWETRGQLSIQEGWLEASGESITHLVNDRLPGKGRDSLVVRFDPTKDVLKGLANFSLPEGRLSVQDILVLFFGDNRIAAADQLITKLRPSLSENGKRNVWLERIQLDNGMVECYVASSRTRDGDTSVDGWRIARSRENPFEIAELEVKSPILEAKCTTTTSGTAPSDATKVHRILEDLAASAIEPRELANPHPFDQATLPNLPSSFSASGSITVGGSAETIEFSVSMLGTEEVDGKKFHWLDLDVTTDPAGIGQREVARILVDANDYPNQPLVVKQGWFAFDNGKKVLPLPQQSNSIESVIDARLQLMTDPRFRRFGVVDLIWMLFKTDFYPRSRLADLRSQIDSLITDRVGKVVPVSFKFGELECVRYEPSIKTSAVEYQIDRCHQVPFGFAAVHLKTPQVDMDLKLQSYEPAGQPLNNSRLIPKPKWKELEEATIAELENRKSRRNWRVWTWENSGRTYKALAEYGGTMDASIPGRQMVLLWDELGRECRIPLACFSLSDQEWVKRGRDWLDLEDPEKSSRRVLMGITGTKGIRIRIGRWDDEQNSVVELSKQFDIVRLQPSDKEWVERHVKSIRSTNPVVTPEGDFARYVR